MSLRKLFSPLLSPQLLQVTVSLGQHPNRERELDVRIRDRNRLIKRPLDCFLCPRTVLQQQRNVNVGSRGRIKDHRERTGSGLDVTSLAARSI